MDEEKPGGLRGTEIVPESMQRYDKKLDKAYERALEKVPEEKSVIIGLAEIPEEDEEIRLRQLSDKLTEYTERIVQINDGFPEAVARDPAGTPQTLISTTHKRDVLRLIMERGQVDTIALADATIKVIGKRLTLEYEDACAVIHDYILTGGKNLTGGTGLNLKS